MDCPISLIGRRCFDLQKTGPEATFKRVCTSKHLQDLLWIAFTAIIFWLVAVFFCVPVAWYESSGRKISATLISTIFSVIAGLTAALAAILSWVYQSGSSRLGAVDLFGCEISTLCRVFLVVDFARSSVDRLKESENSPVPAPVLSERKHGAFTSEENYTPVYDGKLSDLQSLDAKVVTSVTEFYTYRKAMMDYLRKIACELPGSEVHIQLTRQMIYMQFLMYESGHKAVKSLIDFEPNRAESLINIFCSELIVYRALVDEYNQLCLEDSKKYAYLLDRLRLRDAYYKRRIPALFEQIDEGEQNDHWLKAKKTINELRRRYSETFPGTPQSQ